MQAAVTYCGTLYGSDTSTMSRLLAEFRAEEAGTGAATTGEAVDDLITAMRNTTAQFRAETGSVMTRWNGDGKNLGQAVAAARDGNPYILARKDAYWQARTTGDLAGFDAWVQDGEKTLATLDAAGYDTKPARRDLDVFIAKRPDLQAALNAKSEDNVRSAGAVLLGLSQKYVSDISAVQATVPDNARFRFYVEQGYRAVEQADRANNALYPILIDIGEPETVLAQAKTDLGATNKVLGTGNLGAAKTPMRLVQKDFTDLAQAYRDVAHSTSLPADLAAELNTLAIRLDETASQMGASL